MAGWTRGRDAAKGYISQSIARRILHRDHGICHACGHDGAEQVDHIIPWAEWAGSGSPHQDTNLAAIHGARCLTCGRECHKTKTQAEAARGATRRAARGKRPAEPHPGALK